MTDDKNFKTEPVKTTICFADLDRIDVRVGTILSVEDVSGSDKLVRLTVDFGAERRNILAGLKRERQHPKRLKASRHCLWSTWNQRG